MKLSIITPTLNSAATLRATLESIRPLVAAGAEHLVVDSNSTDETAALAETSGARVISYPRGNMYAAINAGMAEAKGDWLTYLNGDDLLYADAVTEALAQLGDSAEVIYGNLDYIDAQGRFLFSWRSPRPQHLPWLMQHYCPFPQQGALFRREVFERAKGFDTQYRFAGDYDFFVRCALRGARFRKLTPRSIAAFRLLPTQLSQRLRGEMAPEGIKIRRELRAARPGLNAHCGRPFASLYRWATNLDSMWLRRHRGRKLDAGWKS
ncbi:MAG: glycosyltransferase family 2 protein [Candidatus Didemnitutus sp.]|nr:glycosyltransferase family 2 protein [Candidatus Didemnitutus sp.]